MGGDWACEARGFCLDPSLLFLHVHELRDKRKGREPQKPFVRDYIQGVTSALLHDNGSGSGRTGGSGNFAVVGSYRYDFDEDGEPCLELDRKI